MGGEWLEGAKMASHPNLSLFKKAEDKASHLALARPFLGNKKLDVISELVLRILDK